MAQSRAFPSYSWVGGCRDWAVMLRVEKGVKKGGINEPEKQTEVSDWLRNVTPDPEAKRRWREEV